MVEHWSEKPGVDSSILSLGILFRLKFVQCTMFLEKIFSQIKATNSMRIQFLYLQV